MRSQIYTKRSALAFVAGFLAAAALFIGFKYVSMSAMQINEDDARELATAYALKRCFDYETNANSCRSLELVEDKYVSPMWYSAQDDAIYHWEYNFKTGDNSGSFRTTIFINVRGESITQEEAYGTIVNNGIYQKPKDIVGTR